MEINLNSLVRSVAVAVVGLPIAFGVNGFLSASTTAIESSVEKTGQASSYDALRGDLTVPCLKYVFSKVDSSLERNAKNTIDEAFGGEVDYKNVCKWIIQ